MIRPRQALFARPFPFALAGLIPMLACAWTASRMTFEPAAALADHPSSAGSVTASEVDHDPLDLLERGRRRCARQMRDFSCVFLRQERLNGRLTARQAIRVLYRDNPKSVYMKWIKNTGRVRRALYVQGRLVDGNGEENALVEPAGVVARLLVSELAVPIRGRQARQSGRFTIDQFGFRSVLERIARDNERLGARGGLKWTYEGTGQIDGRATHVLVRHLPYSGPDGAYPDARLVVHLDQEWLWPVGVYSYADEAEQELLGSYVTTDVKLNLGLTDASFDFDRPMLD